MDMEHLSAVCTGLGSVREDEEGNEVYVKHPDCLGTCKYEKHGNVWFPVLKGKLWIHSEIGNFCAAFREEILPSLYKT